MYKIEMEDIIANAFIKLLRGNKNNYFISYASLREYGKNVKKELESQNEVGVLDLSGNNTEKALSEYSEYFEDCSQNEIRGVHLKCKSSTPLVNEFRGYLPLKLLLAYDRAPL